MPEEDEKQRYRIALNGSGGELDSIVIECVERELSAKVTEWIDGMILTAGDSITIRETSP